MNNRMSSFAEVLRLLFLDPLYYVIGMGVAALILTPLLGFTVDGGIRLFIFLSAIGILVHLMLNVRTLYFLLKTMIFAPRKEK